MPLLIWGKKNILRNDEQSALIFIMSDWIRSILSLVICFLGRIRIRSIHNGDLDPLQNGPDPCHSVLGFRPKQNSLQ